MNEVGGAKPPRCIEEEAPRPKPKDDGAIGRAPNGRDIPADPSIVEVAVTPMFVEERCRESERE